MTVAQAGDLQERRPALRCISVRQLLKGRGEPLLAALVITMVLLGLAALIPAVTRRLSAASTPAPTPAPSVSPPPVAVLLPDQLDKALDGVMTIVNDHTFGTAFLIDSQGDLLTASSLVQGSSSFRLIDNTGGTHQVRLIGVDNQVGAAMLRATVGGTPLTLGDSNTVGAGDPIVLLASPKVENLSPSTSGTIEQVGSAQWTLSLSALPGNVGGPIVGDGAKVLGLLLGPSSALRIDVAEADIAQWHSSSGTLMPLAPFPSTLALHGSDSTTTPTSGASVTSVTPSRASAAQDIVVTVTGSGFVTGPALAVHFVPLAGSSGGFNGLAPGVANPSTLTVKVPAHQVVQDYVIELINGDGSIVSSRVAFTVTP